ncbi:MAG: hypothetical protein GX329_03440 [Tissierellia bacterium]|nr:hypothetical protein [Tissierellia bacterium]
MKKHNIIIILFSMTLALISFAYGYKIMKDRDRGRSSEILITEEEDDSELEILKEGMNISPNTFIEKNTFYKACNHNITKLNNADDAIINMDESQYRGYMKENYPNITIVEFSIERIVLREERAHMCPNHYIIGESDGKIAIYRIDENGERHLDKAFEDYPISLLKKIDQEKLIEGIIVDSEEELSNVLENFIS